MGSWVMSTLRREGAMAREGAEGMDNEHAKARRRREWLVMAREGARAQCVEGNGTSRREDAKAQDHLWATVNDLGIFNEKIHRYFAFKSSRLNVFA